MFSKKSIIDNIKTIFYALIIAVLIRSIFLQPFYVYHEYLYTIDVT